MSDDSTETSRTNATTIVLQRDDGAVLLARDDDRWALPFVETRGHWYAEVAPINAAFERRYGVRATTLRTLAHARDEAKNFAQMIITMELRDNAQDASADARWVAAGEALAAAHRGQRDAIAEWFDEASYDRARPLRREWSRAGWLDQTIAWCRARLAEHGVATTGHPEQMKHWSIAIIWRIPTDGGDVWLKAVPPFFAHEGTLLQLLSPTMREHLPSVIATDREHGLLLMQPLPGDTLRPPPGVPNPLHRAADCEKSLRLLAGLQQQWSVRVGDLLAAGCADRRLYTLDGALEAILARDAVRERFREDELQRLRACGATVPALVEELRGCGVPETLMHGDFYPGNIASDGDRLVIFDWTDGCVSYPLFDLATFLPRDPVEHAAATQTFLEAWQPQIDAATLERAAQIAQPLACIHHATSYMRLLDGIDPSDHWEFASDVLFWLRWLRAIIA